MTGCGKHTDTGCNDLTSGKVVIRPVREVNRGQTGMILQCFYFVRLKFHSVHIELCIRKASDLTGMITVLVSQNDLGDLRRLVARCFQGGYIVLDPSAHVRVGFSIPYSAGRFFGKSRIDQDDVVTCIDHIVLKGRTVFHIVVKVLHTVLAAKGEALCMKAFFKIFDCFDFHLHLPSFKIAFRLTRGTIWFFAFAFVAA